MGFEKTYDVVVAGGGVAGVAAALQCARAGLRTALVEKTVLLGGLATTGMINIYLPLCDGHGHQVLYGIAEELLHLSIRYGPGEVPEGWAPAPPPRAGSPALPSPGGRGGRRSRYMTPFSPAAFVLALDEALQAAGVAIWLDTLVVDAIVAPEDRRLTGLEVENKSGRGVLHAAVVIDATGDADVAYRAGAPCVETDNWLSMWAMEASSAHACKATENPDAVSLLEMVRVGADANGRNQPVGQPKFRGTDGGEVSRFVLEGRRLLREFYQVRQGELGVDGRRQHFPTALPAMAQFRTTRRIDGLATMTTAAPDADLPASVGLVPDWRRPGPVWAVPYGALVAREVKGLLAAGRCFSAEGEAWEVSRVIPPAALTGQIAGVTATLAVRQGMTPDALPVAEVQDALRERGIPLRRGEIIA